MLAMSKFLMSGMRELYHATANVRRTLVEAVRTVIQPGLRCGGQGNFEPGAASRMFDHVPSHVRPRPAGRSALVARSGDWFALFQSRLEHVSEVTARTNTHGCPNQSRRLSHQKLGFLVELA